MAVVKIIIVFQRVVQMHVWNSNETVRQEKGKQQHMHTHACKSVCAHTHMHTDAQKSL